MPRNHNKLSTKDKLRRGTAIAAIGAGALGLASCGESESTYVYRPTQAETTFTTTKPPTAEWEGMSDVAKEYRDRTTTEKLSEAAKTPGELEKLFTVPAESLANKADYAQVWVALDAARKNAGLNNVDYTQAEAEDTNNSEALLMKKYAEINNVTSDYLNPVYTENIYTLYGLMHYHNKDTAPDQQYQLNEKLDMSTLETTENADGSITQTFQMEVDDNWKSDYSSNRYAGLDQTLEVTLADVAANEKGDLQPASVTVTEVTPRDYTGWDQS